MNLKRQNSHSRETPITKHAVQLCCLAAAGLFLCACKPDAQAAGESAITGVYNLVSADGKAVPAKISHDGHELELRSGTFTINADGTCGTKTVFVPPSGTEVTREVKATYTRDGSALTMKWENAGITKGTVEGNTFTMNNEGIVLMYRK